MSGTAPTRSALLGLREELEVTREGYRFLDEKRVLLAAEALAQLTRYGELLARFDRARAEALAALAAMVGRHGLEGVQTYPVPERGADRVETRLRPFLGVTLLESELTAGPRPAAPPPGRRSGEGEAARAAFEALLAGAAELAGVSANLHRLRLEYRRTERRARALEDVLLPALEGEIREMGAALEEMDQEEAVRARRCHVGNGP